MLEHFEREYSINKIYLSYLGVWPYQSKLAKNLFSFFCLVFQVSYYPFQIIMLYDHWKDPQVFEICYQFAALTCGLGKTINMIYNREKIKCICTAMNDHWKIFTNKSEVQILKHYSNISRKIIIVFSTWMCFITVIFFMTPLLSIFLDTIRPLNESRSRSFPVTAKFRIDDEKYYAQLYIYIVSVIAVGVSSTVASDATFLICIVHACSLFSNISEQLESIITKMRINKDIRKFGCCMNTKSEFQNERMIYREYVTCLKKYQVALEFVDMLNSVYKIIQLFFLILNGAIVTCVGIQIINVIDRLEDVIRYIFVIISILTQLLISCYCGQKLRDESQNVFYRAYAAEWYKCSPRLKSLLIFTLRKSIVPCGLTAGDMVPLSLVTYGSILRTAGSYFMTFLSLKE